jgi:hypothetical protein
MKVGKFAMYRRLNDPVVLLGVLFRMRKLDSWRVKYSSEEFAHELRELSNDIKDSVGVDLEHRVVERNIIRNSGNTGERLSC